MNPILRRELLEVLRTRKAVVLQLSLALACALLVLVRWPTGEVADLSGARSLQVLRVFGYGLLAGILLLVPAFPATSLVRERMQGTLALLLNSPLPPWSIYLGKLGGVLGFAAVLLVVTLPAAAACHALGGTVVEGGVAALYGLLVLAALQLCTLALLVSSRSQSTDGALRVTYGLVLAVCFLPFAPSLLVTGRANPLAEPAAWLRCLSPIPAVLEVLGQGDVGGLGVSGAPSAAVRYVLLACLFSLACAAATVSQLRPALLDRARHAGVMTQDRSAREQLFRRFMFLFFFDPQRRSGSMSLWVNPVMVKEFRSRRFGRLHWMLRITALCAILSLALAVVALTGAEEKGLKLIMGALVLLQVLLVILIAPSLASGLISGERESGSWQILRMTPLSAWSILVGKLLSVVWPLVLLLGATLPGYVAMIVVERSRASREPFKLSQLAGEVVQGFGDPTLLRVLACLALTGVFAVLLSAAISTLFRSTAAATTAAYLALLAVCLGPLLVWLGREAPFGHGTVESALTVSPVAAALQAAAAPGFQEYELLPMNWWGIGSACVALLVLLGLRTWQLCRPE
jgi:ABC-type transport system involved in multi-copper enzyme maturation permease subunit